jgi:hypothetical protein
MEDCLRRSQECLRMAKNYNKIPEDLIWAKQWALAGPDNHGDYKAPYGISPRGAFNVSPTQNIHWRDFTAVCDFAESNPPYGIGYILSRTDPFTCIDLDVKNHINCPNKVDKDGKPVEWTTQEQLDRFHKIIKAFDSYTEASASGQGVHIWVRGKIGEGCKRDGVEVYSQERFIVCTGNVILDKAIEERQELLNTLVGEIRNASAPKIELIDKEETESDEVILERGRTADNADKFNTLFSGDWSGYPSQSEADLALLSIFTFYSKSNAQVRRLFRLSGLGKREKATKNDRYLNDTLRTIRSREAMEEQANVIGEAASARLMQAFEAEKFNEAITTQPVAAEPEPEPEHDPDDCADPLAALEPSLPNDDDGIPWPPGLAGAVAQYIFQGAPRPVKEVAIVSALGFIAGVAGKAFCIPQSGLNMYIVLVAQSGVGKEAMHSGIANIVNAIAESEPGIMPFIDFTDYASGPALMKAVASAPSFVNVSGEWGRKLRRMGQEDGRDGPMQQLRTVMTNLYQKSGPKSIVGGIGYSDKEKNVASVTGVAYSMIGETTPTTFYDALTETMMEDGFLSRFTVIEYRGQRPSSNPNPVKTLPQLLLDALCQMVRRAADLNGRFTTQMVEAEPDAKALLEEFDVECDTKINSSGDEGFRQMWNRAHLKTYRISALLAVADNPDIPVITKAHVDWALTVVRKDIGVMDRRISSGDVGFGDAPREKKILTVICKYLKTGVPASYAIPAGMRKDGIVPRKYLQIVTQRSTSFVNHRAGQNAALDMTIKSLIDSGYLQDFPKDKAATLYNFTGKCYRVVNLPKSIVDKVDDND